MTKVAPFAGPAAIVLVVLLGIFFRFWHLPDRLLWHDEVATRVFVAGYTPADWRGALYDGRVYEVEEVRRYMRATGDNGIGEAVAGLARDDPQHPPLYYVLAAAWVRAFGDGIGVLRGLSALLSLLTLPAAYWLGRELSPDRRVAWLAVALFAASPFFVLYAQEAREYALWAALIVTSTAALLFAMRKSVPETPIAVLAGAWTLYGLALCAAMYASFSTASLALAHGLFVIGDSRLRPTRAWIGCLSAFSLTGILFLPWALLFVQHYEAFEASMRWSKEIVIPNSSLLRILGLNASRPILDFWPDIGSVPSILGVLAAVVLAVGALVATRWSLDSRGRMLLLLVIAVPIGLLLVPDLLSGGIRSVTGRYMTASWVALLMAIAALLGSSRIDARLRVPLAVAVLGLGLASCWWNALQDAVWIKGVSTGLPQVATTVNASPRPLVIGDIERHNPGNLLALAERLRDDAAMQFLTIEAEAGYELPAGYTEVYLYTPIPPFRDHLQQDAGVRVHLLQKDDFLQLWKVERSESSPPPP